MKNDFKPVVDHRFNLRADWGAVDCQVLVRRPEQDAVLHVGGLWSRECRHLDSHADEHGDPPAHGAVGLPAGSAAGLSGRQIRLAEVLCRLWNRSWCGPIESPAQFDVPSGNRAAGGALLSGRMKRDLTESIGTYRPADRRTYGLAWQDLRQHPQEHPRCRPRDHRGMEVDGKPGMVSRRNDRGRQRPQREGEAHLCPRGEPSRIPTSSSTRASKATPDERSIFSRATRSTSVR